MSKLQRITIEDARPPSRITRMREALEAIRSIWLGPYNTKDPALARLFAGPATATGVNVSETTALNYAAVYAAVNLISSDVAGLPLIHFRRLPNGGKERFTDSKLYRILHDAPNPETTSLVWRKTMQAHVLTWGNAYSEIERDGSGRPAALWPLTPDRVTPYRRSVDAPLQYRIINGNGQDVILNASDVLHLHGLGWDGTQGYSVIQKARESVGLGLATERFGGTFFGNGTTMGGVLSFKGPKPTEQSQADFIKKFNAEHQGVDRAHKFLALYNDASYTPFAVPPDDAQFLETRKFQVIEVARWFNLPPHKLRDLERATFSNIEQQDLDYYKTTLVNWLETWEQELTAKLIPPSEYKQQMIEHVVEGFLRGDAAARGEFYSKQFSIGAITPNEIREQENRNKMTGGDRLFVPLNMIPADRFDEWLDAEIEFKISRGGLTENPPPKGEKQEGTPGAAAPTPTVSKASYDEVIEARNLAKGRLEEVIADLFKERDAHAQTMSELATMTERLSAEESRRIREILELGESFQASQAKFEAEQTAHQETRGLLNDERKAHGVTAKERDTQGQTIDGLSLDVAQKEADRLAQEERATAANHRADVADALVTELRGRVESAQQDAAAALSSLAATREALAKAEATMTEVSAHRDLVMANRDEWMQKHEALVGRFTHVQTVLRDLLEEAAQRMIDRECERARKAQGSPEKLQRWMETFYEGHREICRRAFHRLLAATALAYQRPMFSTMEEVKRFTEPAEADLKALIVEHDAETLAPALERVLRNWESSRAEAFAADLLKGHADAA